MRPTVDKILECARYWIGYLEKASDKYCHRREKEYFPLDPGDANYTYFGNFCGVNPGQWCAMFVTTIMTEACDGDRAAARDAMYGVWPFTSCGQIWDVAPAGAAERRIPSTPQVGDIIIFSNDGRSRDHTGIVEDLDDTYVYTIEGNSGQQVRRRRYLRSSSWIYGYIHPGYAAAADSAPQAPKYDAYCYPRMPELSKGTAGFAVEILQYIISCLVGLVDHPFAIDGDFGPQTEGAVMFLQSRYGLEADGICGAKTWTLLFSLQ